MPISPSRIAVERSFYLLLLLLLFLKERIEICEHWLCGYYLKLVFVQPQAQTCRDELGFQVHLRTVVYIRMYSTYNRVGYFCVGVVWVWLFDHNCFPRCVHSRSCSKHEFRHSGKQGTRLLLTVKKDIVHAHHEQCLILSQVVVGWVLDLIGTCRLLVCAVDGQP